MPIASVKTYVDQVEQVLASADTSLDEPQRTQLSSAVQERRTVSGDSTVEDLSTQLVAVLVDADANLQPGQVEALEAHVARRLA